MISLVWKDLYTSRLMLLLPIGLFGGLLVFGALTGNDEIASLYFSSLANTYSMLMVPGCAFANASNEEKNRTLSLLRSMPISPQTIVASKFLAPLFAGVLWSLISVAALLLGARLFPNAAGIALRSTPFLGPYLVALTLPTAAMILIVSFAWNANVAGIAFVVLSAALYMISAIFRPAGMSIMGFYLKIMSPTPSMVSIAFAVSLAIYFLGMLVAQVIFVHRELG